MIKSTCLCSKTHRSLLTFKRLKHALNIKPVDGFEEMIRQVKRAEMKGLPIIHHHGYVSDLPIKHRFAMRKFHGVMRYLRRDNVISSKQILQPEHVKPKDLLPVHTEDYINRFFQGQTTDKEQRFTGFKWSEGLVSRCRYETAGTILAAVTAMERGLACSTGGGTHHAFPAHGSGYCLLNDLAVAASYMLKHGFVERVLIVDLDVHQGDGTAYIFKDDKRVFTFSMHCQDNFPHKKQQSDIDVGLDIGCTDEEYLSTLDDHLGWIVKSFRPDLVLYDAGVDPHEKDELGKLKMTDQGLYDRDHYVLQHLASRGIPCATVIGGGYSNDLDELSLRHTIVHRAATQVWRESMASSC
ncbi:uncharacterized protein SYNPCC7002_A1628-like isoform X1 [Haliotis rufescens]|uniref:uncharacterized protein SYNPCC7002_A1628-like isoform X1 n=2 Tax=Haliotis rufescens TaxID=6454 RepID=UPI00201E7510|nr:uncharacterized protein SYNPCC7002_A1628-like isoform X1 [Haliotis rufescens]